jgi:hypothetical protein
MSTNLVTAIASVILSTNVVLVDKQASQQYWIYSDGPSPFLQQPKTRDKVEEVWRHHILELKELAITVTNKSELLSRATTPQRLFVIEEWRDEGVGYTNWVWPPSSTTMTNSDMVIWSMNSITNVFIDVSWPNVINGMTGQERSNLLQVLKDMEEK